MPIHDWTRVDPGIFHAFHHDWITEIARALNRGLLPPAYYALPEQQAAGFGPDVLTLQDQPQNQGDPGAAGAATAVQRRPQTRFTAETEAASRSTRRTGTSSMPRTSSASPRA